MENEISRELSNKIMVMAQAFYMDCKNDKDYPHKDVGDQYAEFCDEYKKGNISLDFIETCFECNK